MSKRLLSLLLTLALCFSMLPSAALAETADAAAEETQNVENNTDVYTVGEDTVVQSVELGDAAVQAITHSDHALCPHGSSCTVCPTASRQNTFASATALTCKNVSGSDRLYAGNTQVENDQGYVTLSAGTYYLTQSIEVSNISIDGDVVLCLNGYSITATADADAIELATGFALTLCDCNGSGNGNGIITHSEGKTGSGVRVTNGSFIMYGGEISGNTATDGGGVFVDKNASFTMYDGSISGNTADGSGNIASQGNGGGVLVSKDAEFNMSGGSICGNTVGGVGSGVYVTTYNPSVGFTMSGSAAIYGNNTTSGDGGVYVNRSAIGNSKIDISGGAQIWDNWKGGTLNKTTGLYEQGSGTANNLCLAGSSDSTNLAVVTVSGKLIGSRPIGISKTGSGWPTTDKPVKIAVGDGYTFEESDADCFTPDADGYQIAYNDTEKAIYLEFKPHKHPICGEVCNHLDANGQPMHKDVEWTAISSFSGQYVAAGHYYLTDSVEVGMSLVPTGNVDLCLNGHTITNKQTSDVISVNKGDTVNLCDCDTTGGGGKIYGDGSDMAHGVYLNGGTLNLYGGTITAREYGVYPAQDGSVFNMYGGTITGSGTGVYMKALKRNETSVFNMTGGTITGNGTGNEDVGGVFVGGRGTFRMSGNAKITNNNKSERIFGAGGVYVAGETGIFEMGGDAEISGNGITIKEGNSSFTSAGAGGVYVRYGTFKMSGNAKITGNTVTNNSSKDVSGGVYIDKNGTMNISGNVSVFGNTDGNVYLTEGKSIAIDSDLGETAVIGVRTPAIAEGGFATIATDAKETDVGCFSDESGKNYTKKFANGNIIFANGEPHEHPVCGDKNCTASGHGKALFSALKADALTKTTGGYYELSEGNWYLAENLNLDATLYIADNARLCLNGYGITTTADNDAIGLANGSALTLCDCNGSGNGKGIITHSDGKTGSGVYVTNGSFTMYGGEISGNTLSGNDVKGAGVFVDNDASFTMHGGKISGNTLSGSNIQGAGIYNRGTTTISGSAVISENMLTNTDSSTVLHSKDGGGIYQAGGTLTVNGYAKIINNQRVNTADEVVINTHGGGIYLANGTAVLRGDAEVTGNQAGSYGAGICCMYGNLSVSDNVQVTDNEEFYNYGTKKPSNVYFSEVTSMPITVTGLLEKARIGVRLSNGVLNDLSSKGIETVTIAQATDSYINEGSFVSDDNKYAITVTDVDTRAVLSEHQHTWVYTASGTTITAECSQCGKSGGSVTLKAPVDSTLTYDGTGKEATLDGSFTTGKAPTISYTSKDGSTKYDVPIDAGDYKASITIDDATAEVTYAIRKALLTVDDFVFTPPRNTIYDGTPKIAEVTPREGITGVGDITLQYYKETPYGFGLAMGGAIDAGTYVVEIRVKDGTNYYNNELPKPLGGVWKFTVNKATYGDKAENGSAMYGNEGTVDLSGLIAEGGTAALGTVTDTDGVLSGAPSVSGTTLSFSFADDASKIGKTATVAVNVTDATNYGNYIITVTLTVENKIIPVLEGSVTLTPDELTYGEPLSRIEISGIMKNPDTGAKVEGTFAWKDKTLTPDAGSYEAEWTFTPNVNNAYMYAPTTGTVTITVNKADIPTDAITPPTAKSGLVYNGDENGYELITPGITTQTGITMQYKLGESGAWSTEIPKATDAGSYNVYYCVLGGENYNDTAEALVEGCAIAKRPVTISHKTGKDGYKTVYMYGDLIQKPDKSNFNITGSEGEIGFTYQWIGEEPTTYSKLGDYMVRVIVSETANTTGVSWDIPVKIVKNTSGFGYGSRFDYRMVYNNTGTVSYDIDFVDGVDSGKIAIDRETLKVKTNGFIIVVRDANGDYITYDEDTCDFKISVEEGAAKGTMRVTLTDLNRDTASRYSFCTIAVQAENQHYANIDIQVRLYVQEKVQQTLGVTMDDFTYGGSASTPAYTEPKGTLETSVTYAKKDGTKLAEAPAETGEYTVTVVCETKDTIYSGSADYTIKPKPISDVVSHLDKNDFTYNGGEQKPNITVKMNDTVLTENDDYTVTYPTDMTNVGTKEIKIKGIGNFSGEKTVSYQINKATVKVKPKDISKVYGDEPKFKLESKSPLITEEELEKVAASAIFESGGAEKTAHVTANGYIISVQLSGRDEPDNLILEADGTGKLTVEKADLTITVKDVSREYGAPNPALEVTYSGFVNGENESVLDDELILKYDESKINEQTAVGFYTNATTAGGLTSDDYNINYVSGNVNITKIKVNASAGTARITYLSAVFDKALAGLAAENFIVKDSEGNTVTVNNITASSDGKTYNLSGYFVVGQEYTVKVVLSGAVDAMYQLTANEFVITPIRINSGGSATVIYTVSFETNGGNKIVSERVKRNDTLTEPATPTKEGFDFVGWYTDKDLKEKYDFSAKVEKNITLYAAWAEKDNSPNQIILTIGEKDALVFGKIKTNDVAPKIVNDRTMLPARFVAENLDAKVSWDGDTKLVTIQGKNLKTSEDITILIYIGSDIAYVNGKECKLDSAAFIENDRTYTPVRFISEELGASVEWIETEQKVVITK